MKKKETFNSKTGFILSCVGAAIGLGNLWMFPWRLGRYGGAVFLIQYLIFVFILGTTGLTLEFALGRLYKQGSFATLAKVGKEKKLPFANFIAAVPTLAVTGTFVFYTIVIGWVLKYFGLSLIGGFKNGNPESIFNHTAGTVSNIPWHALGIFLSVIIVLLGVTKGIEKVNKFMMPTLFIILFVLAVRVWFLPGSMEGVKYLLIPDWSYFLKPESWIMALGQAFFSCSLNGAGMVVYGSYIDESIDLREASFKTASFDLLAGLLSAFLIIPAAFAFNLEVTGGPSLLFITLPQVFKHMPLGGLLCILFFFTVILATLSSSINMLECPTEMLMSKYNFSRKKAAIFIGIISLAIGIPLDLNMNAFGVFSDFITIVLAPLGTLIAVMVFFKLVGTNKAMEEVNKGAVHKASTGFLIIGKFIYPVVIIAIILLGIVYGGI
ncbi:MAG: sodium-dependent transporter [Cellulosilyticaceae bacterium]